MDDEGRSRRRAQWQASTPLARRWLYALAIFVVALVVLLVIAWR